MTYQWKLPGVYSVPAQDAGAELDRIYLQRGKMDAADIVDESRPENAVLHPCFEWRDSVAAEKWREQQARNICCCLVTVSETADAAPIRARTFVHVKNTYRPMTVVVSDKDAMEELAASVLRELRAITEKNRILQDSPLLRDIFLAIETASA